MFGLIIDTNDTALSSTDPQVNFLKSDSVVCDKVSEVVEADVVSAIDDRIQATLTWVIGPFSIYNLPHPVAWLTSHDRGQHWMTFDYKYTLVI
ncbi:MAG: hypothetical protein J07HQW2_00841 [Haloquadratum walsbyi J07HQW2]|jgi:hypothetical protein|uniref:Uncharacterized protein n=1 Tax=Haloquadratum walsbyi J07HQW2 TaxID=1238425 RepID=U1PL50_9EURY|nr:MAG: hypothetical protein J07HQW2_00841 [Haloquadratum walsbyi J07HQW2]